MTSRKELKLSAKQSLSGKWGISVAITLILLLLPFILNNIPILGYILVLVLTPATAFIPQEFFLKIKRNEDFKINDVIISLYSKLGTYWGILIRMFLKILPYWLLTLVGGFTCTFAISARSPMLTSPMPSTAVSISQLIGIILSISGLILQYSKSLYYVLSLYVKIDNSNMTCKEAVLKSRELMTGHRLEYLILTLSFIGWTLLSGLALCIPLFYVIPYMNTTFAAFYDDLKNNAVTNTNNEAIQF